MNKKSNIAIVLAAGKGSRMKSEIEKQFLVLGGKPLLYYSLKTFEESEIIDQVIVVTNADRITYVKEEIVEKYHLNKVRAVIKGGKERYLSVWEGLQYLDNQKEKGNVFIHDSARALVSEEILERAYQGVKEFKACAVGMPTKDTVKIVNDQGFVEHTPKRSLVWNVQTPQVFTMDIAYEAYKRLIKEKVEEVTDDAMVVETMLKLPIKLIEGSYENFKITTPEDLIMAENLLKK